jgi:hypothetical protein
VLSLICLGKAIKSMGIVSFNCTYYFLLAFFFCQYAFPHLLYELAPLDLFQGAYMGVCSQAHVPSYKNNIDKLKAKGIDSVICVAVNDPYVLNGWAEKLEAKDAVSNCP